MRVYNNFLDPQFIQQIVNDNERLKVSEVWKTNYSWPAGLIRPGSVILSRSLAPDQVLSIYKLLAREKILEFSPELSFFASAYLWLPLSNIPWHDDTSWKGSATIYLNPKWELDWGGYLMWVNKQDNEIKVLIPEFNRLIVNTHGVGHSTTLTSPDAHIRSTIQCFWR